jgi:transposase
LTKAQENKIKKTMLEKYPDQLKFDFALWTRGAVKMLIMKLFSIDMPVRTVGQYLQRWNFTPQKPIKHSHKRDEEKIKRWKKSIFPGIKKKAKQQKAEIYWEDETSIETGDIRGKGYAPKGSTPIVKNTEIKIKISMISAITNQGKVFWKLHSGTIDAVKFLEFVKRLVYCKKKKIFLILDNARVHHSKILAAWLKENKDKIELFFIPPYSPELNPDEHVNSDLKYGVGSQRPKKTENDLSSAADEHMNMLKNNPFRIKKYFKDKNISYAA